MRMIYPDPAYFASYEESIREYLERGLDHYNFLRYDREHFFGRVENFRTGRNLPPSYVACTYLWLVEDDEFVGEVSIRHDLTDALLRYGGHIGYWVRCTRWNEGKGTQMLADALDYVRDHLPLQKVLVTCDDDNIGSARVIEKNGGVLENKVTNVIGGKTILTRRYWIAL